jgi:hypothetical protein
VVNSPFSIFWLSTSLQPALQTPSPLVREGEGEGADVIISETSGVWGSGLQSCKVDEMLRAPSKRGGKGDTLKVPAEEITFVVRNLAREAMGGKNGSESQVRLERMKYASYRLSSLPLLPHLRIESIPFPGIL